ncbi:MAG: hypothetical protein JNM24_17405 [Bdellovibrionaceae bacterium]|nr:hypothetical protein [Pseudobdellovibrionaceae bacterium]
MGLTNKERLSLTHLIVLILRIKTNRSSKKEIILHRLTESKINYLLCLSFLIFSISCTNPDFQSAGDTQKEQVEILNTTNDEFANLIASRVDPTDKPKIYQVSFSWPKFSNGLAFRIRQGSNQSPILVDQSSFSHSVDHNQQINYTFELVDSTKKIIRTTTKSVRVPIDLVIDENFKGLTEDLDISIQRLYLSEHPLITNGHNLKITASSIFSENGKIKSFSKPPKNSESNSKGKFSGNIEINAKTLLGSLSIDMISGNGGPGKNGADYTERAKSGANAGYPFIDCTSRRDYYPEPRKPGQIPNANFCKCGQEVKATPGINGLDGMNGSDGTDGGDIGNVKVHIEQVLNNSTSKEESLISPSNFVKVTLFPGTGGKGGKGSKGQLGGLGGAAFVHNECKSSAGPDGSNGSDGINGNDGKQGKKGLTCIYIASENINECY